MAISQTGGEAEEEMLRIPMPQGSPGIIPLQFYLWSYLRESVYSTWPARVQKLRHEIERSKPCQQIFHETFVTELFAAVSSF
jgi:hypothetical protein